jgi:hypothetical protein
MDSITDNPFSLDRFEKLSGPCSKSDQAELDILSWSEIGSAGITERTLGSEPLRNLPAVPLRIIFAPLDLHNPWVSLTVLGLVKQYGIPPAFLSERLQSVTHSFGHRKQRDDVELTWFHFLSKDITILPRNEHSDQFSKTKRGKTGTVTQTHADYAWVRSSFFLRVEPQQSNTESMTQNTVILICFGSSFELQSRFRDLLNNINWSEAVKDPFTLLSIVIEDLSIRVDNIGWNLADVFRNEETVRVMVYKFRQTQLTSV